MVQKTKAAPTTTPAPSPTFVGSYVPPPAQTGGLQRTSAFHPRESSADSLDDWIPPRPLKMRRSRAFTELELPHFSLPMRALVCTPCFHSLPGVEPPGGSLDAFSAACVLHARDTRKDAAVGIRHLAGLEGDCAGLPSVDRVRAENSVLSWVRSVDVVAVYTDAGVTPFMNRVIRMANNCGKEVDFYLLNDVEDLLLGEGGDGEAAPPAPTVETNVEAFLFPEEPAAAAPPDSKGDEEEAKKKAEAPPADPGAPPAEPPAEPKDDKKKPAARAPTRRRRKSAETKAETKAETETEAEAGADTGAEAEKSEKSKEIPPSE
jgi:hypothetical protein